MHHRGLSLIEVLIVLCLITVLAVVSLPMLTRASGEARSTACRANLVTLGQYLETYHDSNGRLPALMNRDSAALDVPTLDALFSVPNTENAIFRCPGDDREMFARSGTSYRWYTPWDNQPLLRQPAPLQPPILSDKAPFHTEQQYRYNALYFSSSEADESRPGLVVSPYAMPH